MTVKVFLCHHENDARYSDELAKHLRAAERRQEIELWSRRRVRPGEDVRRAVDEKLEEAGLVLVLMSADLIDCDYCWGVEVSAALQRHRAGRALVVPVIVRACDYRSCFPEIGPVPSSGAPIVTDSAKIDDARFLEAATEILGVVRSFAAEEVSGATAVTAVTDILAELQRLERQSGSNVLEATAGLLRLSAGLRYLSPAADTAVLADDDALSQAAPENALALMRRVYTYAYNNVSAPSPSGSSLPDPAAARSAPPRASPAAAALSMRPGDYVKPTVRLVSKLGKGGMGTVWVAEHVALGTLVAVKLMTPRHLENAELRQRFKQEAHILARIQSPHVVQVQDYGETDAGIPYILMELLDGETLGSRLQRLGPLPLADVVRVVTQIASALGRAHELGIVHRDLKPENIFLIRVGGELFVKVIDFGVAKLPPADLLKMLTATGQLIGTANYMSPEAMVSSRDVDHRADVWALAAVAYEALTGRRPFQGQSFGEVILVVHAGVFKKPSTLRPGLPEAIDTWAERALKRDPADRFGSVREAADAFEQAARDVPGASAAPVSTSARVEPARPSSAVRPEATPAPAPRSPAETVPRDDAHFAAPTLVSGDREIATPELQVGRGTVRLVLGSLLRAGTEALVSPADGVLSGSGPLDARIRAAAGSEVEEELRRIGTCEPGGAVLTGAGRIPPPVKALLHAVAPSYTLRSNEEHAELLGRAHAESLRLAEERGLQSVAFPALGVDGSGYPVRKAAAIAFAAAVKHLAERSGSVRLIVFVLHSPADFAAFAAALAENAAALAATGKAPGDRTPEPAT